MTTPSDGAELKSTLFNAAHHAELIRLLGYEHFHGMQLAAQNAVLIRHSCSMCAAVALVITDQSQVAKHLDGSASAATYVVSIHNDFRACATLVERGYPLQALSVVAGMLDALALLPLYCLDSDGTARFHAHEDRKHAGSKTTIGLRNVAQVVNEGLPMTSNDLGDLLCLLYEDASSAKHKNPLSLKGSAYTLEEAVVSVAAGPASGGIWSEIAARAMHYASVCSSLAALLFIRQFLPNDPRISSFVRLAAEFLAHSARDDQAAAAVSE